MFPELVGGIINGVVGIGTQLMQNAANRKNIRLQNEYNSPVNQMARYREAGLNPNLMYGQVSSGNQSQPVQTSVPPVAAHGTEAILKMLAIEDAKKTIALKDAQINAVNQATYNGSLDAVYKRARGVMSQSLSGYSNELARYQSEQKRLELDQLLQNMTIGQARLLNLGIDKDIKSSILTERRYFNNLRYMTGIEKGDSILFRGGYNFYNRANQFINQHLRH